MLLTGLSQIQSPLPRPAAQRAGKDMADHRLSQVSTASSTNSKRAKAHIGPWQLGRTLGRGSSGRVRLAKHVETGKLAAVKIVPKAQITGGDQPNASNTRASESYGIEREVIIMKLIEHPNIMGLYDVWENKGELYLVLEYIEGGELFDYLISRGRLSEREAVHYFRQICYGVDYCHQFNICHRDLKPENLLLDKHRNIKIADFGMAALEANGRLLETSCGSPHYASPEIITGKTYHGAPSDIWSCGIILFALLTGHLPFDDDNIRQLLLKVQAGHFTMPSSLSVEAQDLISRMLTVDPSDRIAMSRILSHPLLQKYPARSVPVENGISQTRLPSVVQPIGRIDREILRNLQTLWHHDSRDTLVARLRAPGPSPEKTFYSLLLRFRQRHGLASREGMPRNRSTASVRSMRSSKSVRSISSLRSSRSNRSVISARSARSRRTRRSPVKQRTPQTGNTKASNTGTTSPHTSLPPPGETDMFAQLLDEAFNAQTQRTSSVPSQPSRSIPSADMPAMPAMPSMMTAARGADRSSTGNAPSTKPGSPMQTIPSASTTAHTESSLKPNTGLEANQRVVSEPARPYSLDFDFTGPILSSDNNPPAPKATLTPTTPTDDANYLLPMIFEEDRFADAIEEEMELKVYKRNDKDGSGMVSLATGMGPSASKAGDNSQLRITNLVQGESFFSYEPSPAAASVPPPRREAPRAPSGPRAMPQRKPVPIYNERDEARIADAPEPKRTPLAPLSSAELSQPRRRRPTQNAQNSQAGGTQSKKMWSQVKPAGNDIRTNSQSSTAAPVEKKKSWIRRLTPRLVSFMGKETSTPAAKDETFVDKENVLPQRARSKATSTKSSAGASGPAPRPHRSVSEEPRQNWFMKILSSSQQSSRSLLSPCQPIELRAIVLEVISEWLPHGLALYSNGARGEPIVVAIQRSNALRLKPARIGIDIKPAAKAASQVRFVHQRGSRSSFMAFANEMERRLGENNVLGLDD